MNCVQLIGRLTRDPDIRYSDGGSCVAKFSLAVDRRFKKHEGANADFIPCTAFGKTAEFIEKWFRKGQRLGLTGRIQTGSYTNNEGKKVYTTDVIVEAAELVESKGAAALEPSGEVDSDGFMSIPDGVEDEGLPFN